MLSLRTEKNTIRFGVDWYSLANNRGLLTGYIIIYDIIPTHIYPLGPSSPSRGGIVRHSDHHRPPGAASSAMYQNCINSRTILAAVSASSAVYDKNPGPSSPAKGGIVRSLLASYYRYLQQRAAPNEDRDIGLETVCPVRLRQIAVF